jgi:DNA invertase Pin-like site-specific DNA recombinase
MATKPTKIRRARPHKNQKPSPSIKPKRHVSTRSSGEIHGPGYKIGYARVSTLDQNLALQQDALKEAGCEKIYVEQMSGAVTDRPALREVLTYARSGDTLIVWKLDRLGRSLRDLIHMLDDFKRQGIKFKSLTEAIDTETPTGRAMWQMIGVLAELERYLITERTRAGVKAARAGG